ncbi:MAG: DUF1329 domain-containing protein [Defluviicoccus sp.]|nr:DUF1329 domain-containing protein [Defluviicoccus sp.]MDE0384643.1 DUF1329 domain-containing protein [Defluviicoccus sp.]
MNAKNLTTATVPRLGAALLLGWVFAGPASAGISADQIARLGADLTPLGGQRAGGADGAIPEWTGGIVKPPAGYEVGEHHRDPYAGDRPRFVIDAGSLDRHRDRLSVGHQRMLETYSSFRMQVYPTRRSASVPRRIYDATRHAAATAELVDGGNGVAGAVIGIPFPIPRNGLEVIWNHLLRYRGESVACVIGQAAVTRGGAYTLVKQSLEIELRYSLPGMTLERLGNTMILFKQKTLAPARLAGDIVLVHETMNQLREPRKAWTYNPGQRRVRRAPNIAYDNPGTSSDGLRTADQLDMFNGAVDRYDWKLVGKREMYVPYNSYRLHGSDLAFTDILQPLHVNPDLLRYELHRVWVVEAMLKEGASHTYKRRTFYVDEDSWQILVADIYDNRDQLWRVSEAHLINYYEKPLVWPTLEVHSDLQAGRYLAFGLDNEFPMCTWDTDLKSRDFTPAALRREGRR